jgi:hypothetical protein
LGIPELFSAKGEEMAALGNSSRQVGMASACRLIRHRWNPEQQQRRRRIAKVKQRELQQLLQSACAILDKKGAGTARASADLDVRLFDSSGAVCFAN